MTNRSLGSCRLSTSFILLSQCNNFSEENILKNSQYYSENSERWLIETESTNPIDFLEEIKYSLNKYGLFIMRTKKKVDKEAFLDACNEVGTAVNQSPEGCLIFEVKNKGYDPSHPKFRGPSSNQKLTFHSDRCDCIVFHCVRQAESGGENMFVHAETLYKILEEESPELLRILEENFPYKRHNADPAHPLPYYELPVFDRKDELCLTLMTYLIEKADKDPKLPNLTTHQRQALDKVQQICHRPEVHLRTKLQEGDILFLNNLQMLHSRTAFTDSGNRLYYRVWLSLPWSFELPKSFESLFRNVKAGSVRGGFRKES